MRTVTLAAPDVADLLAEAGAPLEQRDTVVPAAQAPVTDGMQIGITRNRIDKITERVPLPPALKRIEDPTLNQSRQVVEDPGAPGTQDVTFAVAKRQRGRDGQVASSQCRCNAGARWRGAGGHETRYRRTGGGQLGDTGRPSLGAKPEVIGPSTPATVTTAASNSTRTRGSAAAV